jgi:hypothetical protein
MSSVTKWIPMKWPCGPLEVELRQRQATLSEELRQTLELWLQPSALEIVEKTPVNCLVVRWAAGLPQDEEQQKRLKPLLEKGKEAGVCFAGVIEGGADKQAAVKNAAGAGLSAIISSDASKFAGKFPTIESFKRSTLSGNMQSPLLACDDALWPRLRSNVAAGTDSIVAGPTGVPWVDSNGWYVQLARTLSHEKPIWLMFDPPKTTSGLHEESYLIAMADTEAYGARWAVSLDDQFRSELASRSPSGLKKWKGIADALFFFQKRQEWNSYLPESVLAVVSDFSGANEFLSGEVLNLLRRRQLAFSIVEKSSWTETSLRGAKAVLWIDQEPVGKEQEARLFSFAEKGGLLIVPKMWGKIPGTAKGTELDDRFEIYSMGKGRVAVARAETEDPYEIAEEAHLLLSRRNDLFRLWNAGSFNGYLTASPDRKKSLLQLINYAGRNAEDLLSVWVGGAHSHARVWRPCSENAASLDSVPMQNGQEYHLPPIGYYVAIEMENML